MTDYSALLGALVRARVDFIMIGGAAAIVHGSARLTEDLDVVYRRSDENHRRLVAALAPLDPYLRGAPPGLPFRFDLATVERGLNFTLETTAGDLDVFGEVVGGGSYEELESESIPIDVFGLRCLCVDLKTLIRLKRAAGRPKDLEALAELEDLTEETGEKPPT